MKSLGNVFLRSIAAVGFALVAFQVHAAPPKIAVTDFTYEERVREYFRVVSASSQASVSASARASSSHYRDTESARYNAQASSEYYEAEGTYSYIESGELRKFTADLKGALIRGGGVRLVQAKPYNGKDTDQIYDIIARIKKGLYPGADYVLFGTVSDIQFSEGGVAFGKNQTETLTLELAVDFSLINTRTYEVRAAFSAMGTGQDVKIQSAAGTATLSRPKVIREVSQTLAEDAYTQLVQQFSQASPAGNLGWENNPRSTNTEAAPERQEGPVTVY